MTKDVMYSLLGNIPVASPLAYAVNTDQSIQATAGISGVNALIKEFNKPEKDMTKLTFKTAELFGLPKQIGRTVEGIKILKEGGVRDRREKLLAPVKDSTA